MKAPGKITAALFLKTIEIDSVIWIDDEFASDNHAELSKQFSALVAIAKGNNIILSHAKLTGLNEEGLPEAVLDKLTQDVLASIEEEDLLEIVTQITADIVAVRQELLGDRNELTRSQFSTLIKGLGVVKSLSFKAWEREKAAILPACTERTLFLVDREADKENLGKEYGDTVVEALATAQGVKPHCVMLTHGVSAEEADDLRHTIIGKSQSRIPPHYFSVMSKRTMRLEPEKTELEFCRAGCAVFTNRLCYDLADCAVQAMTDSLKTGPHEFASLSIDDIDGAIFDSSLEEGAMEMDIIERVLNLRQRNSLIQKIAGNQTIAHKLGQLRQLRAIGINAKLGIGKTATTLSASQTASRLKLQQWRRSEILTDGALINGIHSPIACGDVFEKSGSSKAFVLLRQPCDLSTRSDGTRKAKEGIWVQISKDRPPNKVNDASLFRLEGAGAGGTDWVADFRNSGFVDLSILDLASFSSNGSLSLKLTDKGSSLFLPGTHALFVSAIAKLQRLKADWPKQCRLSYSAAIPDGGAKWNGSEIIFKYSRTCRINQPWAQALLGSFAAYHTRMAYDHNFAKLVSQDPEQSPIAGVPAVIAQVTPIS